MLLATQLVFIDSSLYFTIYIKGKNISNSDERVQNRSVYDRSDRLVTQPPESKDKTILYRVDSRHTSTANISLFGLDFVTSICF